ncbi:phage holin family protein [Xylophilus sp.]|uniref:phage holin family protein n=1 Tax=Xylophilus sp. TaxID=2653893 RepID=UPI0013BE7E95|nr:phage holin family protein [Xylophilus sp.]KAF1047820.1 MAG: hypothetical protein GAK38_01763 [Xylophilus sp.]
MSLLRLLGLDGLVARGHKWVIEGAIAAEDRLELASLEWQAEKKRLQYLVVLGVLLAGLTVVALTALSFAIVVHYWDTPSRRLAAWLVALAWLVAWAAVLAGVVAIGRRARHAFILTRRELQRDWQAVKGTL